MILDRVDGDKGKGQKVDRIELIIDGKKITLTEQFGQLEIQGHCDDLLISCGSRNSFSVITK